MCKGIQITVNDVQLIDLVLATGCSSEPTPDVAVESTLSTAKSIRPNTDTGGGLTEDAE
jgi:hypothetical protein